MRRRNENMDDIWYMITTIIVQSKYSFSDLMSYLKHDPNTSPAQFYDLLDIATVGMIDDLYLVLCADL